jgi:hypothetical protein
MARLISATGVTAGGTIGSPMEGMKWIVKYALVTLNTGTGSGTRSASLIVQRSGISYLAETLASISTSSTSVNYSAIGDVINSANTIFYEFPEIYAIDVVQFNITLISGDTASYYLLVEEASS